MKSERVDSYTVKPRYSAFQGTDQNYALYQSFYYCQHIDIVKSLISAPGAFEIRIEYYLFLELFCLTLKPCSFLLILCNW